MSSSQPVSQETSQTAFTASLPVSQPGTQSASQLDSNWAFLNHTTLTEGQTLPQSVSDLTKALYDIQFALDQSAIVVITDANGVITFVNDKFCDISQYNRAELIGKTHRVVNSGYHSKNFFKHMWHTIQSGHVWKGEIQNQAKDGSLYWVDTTIVPFLDSERKPYQFVAISHDITQKKHIEADRERAIEQAVYTEHLERINRDLDQFAYITSHDLKAPLRGIISLTEWIAEDLESVLTDSTREQMDLLKNRVYRMEQLINGILSYSRVGRIKESKTQVSIHLLLTEVIDSLSPPEGFTIKIQSDPLIFDTPKIALQQVFSNLISNAIKYHPSPRHGVLDISWKMISKQWACFRVMDNGNGIPDNATEKVFQMFQTLQPKEDATSTGVGLAIVKKIVEELSGSIQIDTNYKGGAAFEFDWPLN
ncbi:MAG: PAS domain-containing sensor histidine kinase [Cyanobacteria bacterium]|nr:PAS domain-containing sensor histidine kinase [Cyanobacteriota bacterium]